MSSVRKQHLSTARSLVVKLGTQLLTDFQSGLDEKFLSTIARQIFVLRDRGIRITVVSSGAIGAGVSELKLPKRPTDLSKLQAVAAIGQRRLMDAWAEAFSPFGLHVAQLLLTREDIDDRTRFLNVRNTIHAVHELGGIPIINENDTISTDEIVKITFGDNDILAALVAHALQADVLVLLSVVDGIQDAAGTPVRVIQSIDNARELVRAEKSALGKGGMDSKVNAARMVTDAGSAMVVADGRMPDCLIRLLDHEEIGTLFVAAPRKMSGRNRWIGAARPAGTIIVDDGAVIALIEKNKSLLPAGIVKITGNFAPGDVVEIAAADGRVVGRGLSNYAASEVERIKGKKTKDVREVLKEAAYDEVVHRDNLVVGGGNGTQNDGL
jgi:glutamate 5-kinase